MRRRRGLWRRLGRRTLFFGTCALVCLVLVPATPPELRWVTWATAGLAAFWTVLFGAEDLLSSGEPREPATSRLRREEGTPFAPPPRPGSRP